MSHQLEGLRNNERGLHRYCPGARYLPLRRGTPAAPPRPASVRSLSLTTRSHDLARIEEMVRVADAFQLCDVTVHLAVNYLDRLLVRSAGHARRLRCRSLHTSCATCTGFSRRQAHGATSARHDLSAARK
jgi:hypothetical protein